MLILALDWRRLNFRIIACGAGPVAAGAAIFAAYILQDFTAFQEQMRATIIANAAAFSSRGFSVCLRHPHAAIGSEAPLN